MILSGGTDKLINVWDYGKGELCCSLIGHSQNICKLTVFPVEKKTSPFVFGSTSWDGTARCWTEELSPDGTLTLKMASGEAAILPCWSIAALGRDVFATAHADRSVRIWRGDREVLAIDSAHNDVVRDLYAVDNESFVSVGNDGTVKVWNISDGTEIQSIPSAHPSFIYGVTWNGSDRLATFGEEGIVKIWKWQEKRLLEEETIRVPMMSSWSALFLDEATLIIGGSSGTLYKFTSNGSSNADLTETYAAEMAAFDSAANASKSAEIEKNCQDESVLRYPGERTGKTILVRRSQTGKIEAHQWDGMEWQNLGEVLDPLSVKSPDFTFKVELDDTGKSYNLTYNWGENPYSVAKNFLERNDLPIAYLDQVANFIVKNAGTPPPTSSENVSKSQDLVKPEMFKVEAYNAAGVQGKLKSFGLEEINEATVCEVLTKWPVDKLFPCLDWLRFNILNTKNGNVNLVLKSVPFDAILEAGSNGNGKEATAAVTMTLRLLCNASTVSDQIDPGLFVKVIGKCTNSDGIAMHSTTWIPLLIGLLWNVSVQGIIDNSKQMALLHGLLVKINSFKVQLNEDSIARIEWILKDSSKPIPMAASLGNELENIVELKKLTKLLN